MGGCSHAHLPGTTIRQTSDNRPIYDVLEEIRTALEERDSKRLMAVVSRRYFEDNGTATNRDDFGFLELDGHLMRETLAVAKELELQVQLYDIVVRGDHAHADLRYAMRTRMELPGGRFWDTHRDFNRIEFAREQGAWKVISGL